MFSFKKSALGRRLTGMRNRFGSQSRRSVDVEAAPSGSSSVMRLSSTEAPALSNATNTLEKKISKNRAGSRGQGDTTLASRSEPILGPKSNPNDFMLVGESGCVIPKSKSAGAIVMIPAGSASGTDTGLHANNVKDGQRSGLRRRLNKSANAAGNVEAAGPSTGTSGVVNGIDQENGRGGNHMEMVPIVGGPSQEVVAASVQRRPQYVQGYLDTMFLFGTSRYIPRAWRDTRDWASWFACWIQLLVFFGLGIWSCMESFCQAKSSFLDFMADGELSSFVDFSYHVFCLITKLYANYQFTFKTEDIDNMLTLIEEYETEYDSQADYHCNHWKWIILGICIGTLVISVAETGFDEGFANWSMQEMGRQKSFRFSQDTLMWGYKDMERRQEELLVAYGRIGNYNVGFSILSALMNISSDFQMGSLRDLVLFVVFVIFLIVFGLMKGIKQTMENAPDEDVQACLILQERRESLWKQYRKSKSVITASNVVLDVLLQFLHIDNLLLYAYFASMCLDRDEYTAAVIYAHYAFNIVKAELTYILASSIAAQNKTMKKWIRQWSCHTGKIVVDDKEYDASIILDEMADEPMGIGTGMFLINEEFHKKFLLTTGSLVLFLAEARKKLLS